jgi:hypothetical protein
MSEPRHVLPFPCYAIMSNDCKGGVVLSDANGSPALALFTTEDKVRKFRAANLPKVFAGPSVKFDWDHELLLYLNALPPTVTMIGFDYESRDSATPVHFVEVAAMKAELDKRIADKSEP